MDFHTAHTDFHTARMDFHSPHSRLKVNVQGFRFKVQGFSSRFQVQSHNHCLQPSLKVHAVFVMLTKEASDYVCLTIVLQTFTDSSSYRPQNDRDRRYFDSLDGSTRWTCCRISVKKVIHQNFLLYHTFIYTIGNAVGRHHRRDNSVSRICL